MEAKFGEKVSNNIGKKGQLSHMNPYEGLTPVGAMGFWVAGLWRVVEKREVCLKLLTHWASDARSRMP